MAVHVQDGGSVLITGQAMDYHFSLTVEDTSNENMTNKLFALGVPSEHTTPILFRIVSDDGRHVKLQQVHARRGAQCLSPGQIEAQLTRDMIRRTVMSYVSLANTQGVASLKRHLNIVA